MPDNLPNPQKSSSTQSPEPVNTPITQTDSSASQPKNNLNIPDTKNVSSSFASHPVKKSTRYLFLLSLVLIFLIASFLIIPLLGSKSVQPNPNEFVNNSGVIIASYEKPFFVELPTSLTNGYLWQADFDQEILKLNNISYKKLQAENAEEAKEIQIFEFQPLNKNNTQISFTYTDLQNTKSVDREEKIYSIEIR